MPTLTEARIADLLAPYLADGPELPENLMMQVSRYVDLLLLWNAKTNLTAIRDSEMLLQRQIGESLFAARLVSTAGSLMDFGSGGGFPGIPLKLALPDLQITLAESQGKKASFLREAARTLGIKAEIWSSRVESMPAEKQFDIVAMRAVDQTASMVPVAVSRIAPAGSLLRYLSSEDEVQLEGWNGTQILPIPLSTGRLALWTRAE